MIACGCSRSITPSSCGAGEVGVHQQDRRAELRAGEDRVDEAAVVAAHDRDRLAGLDAGLAAARGRASWSGSRARRRCSSPRSSIRAISSGRRIAEEAIPAAGEAPQRRSAPTDLRAACRARIGLTIPASISTLRLNGRSARLPSWPTLTPRTPRRVPLMPSTARHDQRSLLRCPACASGDGS